jgi:hypothetical protein
MMPKKVLIGGGEALFHLNPDLLPGPDGLSQIPFR